MVHSRPARRRYFLLVPSAVALALAAPSSATAGTSAEAAATPKKRGVYVARTSQGLPARFNVTRTGKVVIGRIREQLECGGFGFWEDNEPFRAGISRRGRIGGGYTHPQDLPDDPNIGEGDLTGTFTHDLTARFTRARAGIWTRLTGVWHTHLVVKDGSGTTIAECDTGLVRFTARLRR